MEKVSSKKIKIDEFFIETDKLENQLLAASLVYGAVFCFGDANVAFTNINSPLTRQLSYICESLNLRQVITEPTRLTNPSASLIDIIVVLDMNFDS